MVEEKSFGESPLKKQIRKQVDRCGQVIKGDLEGVEKEDLTKYVNRVSQSVTHLQDLVEPYATKEFKQEIEDIKSKNYNKTGHEKELEKASERFRITVKMLHREGII